PARFAGRLHDQLDVTLAVERAGVANVAVVVDHVDDVGRLAPANALQMNSKRGADWATADVEWQCRRLDPEVSGLLTVSRFYAQLMRPAQVVRHVEAKF